jgi:hypothetical protein
MSHGPLAAPESSDPLDPELAEVPLELPPPELAPESDSPELLPLEELPPEVDPPLEVVLFVPELEPPYPLRVPELLLAPLEPLAAPELAALAPELPSSPEYGLDVSFELQAQKIRVDEQTMRQVRARCSMPSGSDDAAALPSEKVSQGVRPIVTSST